MGLFGIAAEAAIGEPNMNADGGGARAGSINGTWLAQNGFRYTFQNATWEFCNLNSPGAASGGTFFARDNIITLTRTWYNGMAAIEWLSRELFGLIKQSERYSRDELNGILNAGGSAAPGGVRLDYNFEPFSTTYSISGDVLYWGDKKMPMARKA